MDNNPTQNAKRDTKFNKNTLPLYQKYKSSGYLLEKELEVLCFAYQGSNKDIV